MTDHKISSDTNDFTIPADPARSTSREIVIKMPQRGKYDVYQKDFPATLPVGYTWLNNFGLKLRPKNPNQPDQTNDTSDSDKYEKTVDFYIIELDDLDGKEPVYFDGSTVRNFPSPKVKVAGKTRIQVQLNLGDPPVGWP
ncbi:MAG TPA: hypothetical protein VGK00_00255 [Anaerolineales bacterium]|jgi:hypothetical protein